MKLTDEQKEAVLSIDGNYLVMASAGSGKTSSFVTRIAYMIQEKGISPSEILAITFTKKASEEMKKRLSKMIGKNNASLVSMGTFHSIAYRLLKTLDDEFTKQKIAPDWWRFQILNDLCKEGNDKNPHGLNIGIMAGQLSSFVSYQKSNMIHYDDELLIDENVGYVSHVSPSLLKEAYKTYERLKEQTRQIDFDDMLLKFYDKLKTDTSFKNKVSNQYKYIMVDEFQDTSKIVIDIIKLINPTNVFVVGDFRQSIYKFINANVENILNFGNTFDDVKTIELNKNFRSSENIVNLSNKIIEMSDNEKYKQFKPSESVNKKGEDINFSIYESEYRQFEDISSKIEKMNEDGKAFNEMAILVRTNAQTAIIEEMLAEKDIPYDVSKSMSFFDRKEVLDLLSYARIAVDQNDDVSFRRVINTPNRYLGKKFTDDLEVFSSSKDMSLLNAIRITPQNSEWKFRNNINSFLRVIDDLKTQVESNVNAGRFMKNIVRSLNYISYIENTTATASSIPEKIESVEKICEMASKFPNIRAFLAHIISIKDKQRKSKGKDAVQIMTLHSSKGLEWDVVFLPNNNEEIMPHNMNSDVEEERRLFYVGVSRPRKELYISWYLYDRDAVIKQEGQFIQEVLGESLLTEIRNPILRGEKENHYKYD
ncbi:ATP-dependent helicase (plasmid) [Bacillus velezensis]|uniref:ATP-dependent helicase n=1 Tax=Bacillus velezensis TaxID=492670 RepID=UPI002025B06B|nr:ATP-dependent helicase [Bacillus velezensis]URJ76460.1 ATP-dependent helicase [Bacillus velezensis]URJ80416.1 ATP-dependent helicase [Bacillus velezensis]